MAMTQLRPEKDAPAGLTETGRQHDDALMMRIAKRDAVAFRYVVDAHSASLHRIAYRMLGDPSAAEDVAQEALMRLWQNAPSWRGGGPGIAAWLRRVATNACLDRLRRKKFQSGDEIPEVEDQTPLADAIIEANQKRATIKAALARLSDRQRVSIVLTYYEELSNAEAAEILDMNVKAFESLLFRARAALKNELLAKGGLA